MRYRASRALRGGARGIAAAPSVVSSVENDDTPGITVRIAAASAIFPGESAPIDFSAGLYSELHPRNRDSLDDLLSENARARILEQIVGADTPNK